MKDANGRPVLKPKRPRSPGRGPWEDIMFHLDAENPEVPDLYLLELEVKRASQEVNPVTNRYSMQEYARAAIIMRYLPYLSENRDKWDEFAAAIGHKTPVMIAKLVGAYRYEYLR